jgi:hypothetical protein
LTVASITKSRPQQLSGSRVRTTSDRSSPPPATTRAAVALSVAAQPSMQYSGPGSDARKPRRRLAASAAAAGPAGDRKDSGLDAWAAFADAFEARLAFSSLAFCLRRARRSFFTARRCCSE